MTVLYFVWVKYLVIKELTIVTLFAQVFVMRHQMICCQFLCFSIRLFCGFLKNHKISAAALLLHTNRPSAVPVESHTYNDSVTRVARRLQVPTMCSRDILLQANGYHLSRVQSDQMVLEMIRGVRLVR